MERGSKIANHKGRGIAMDKQKRYDDGWDPFRMLQVYEFLRAYFPGRFESWRNDQACELHMAYPFLTDMIV